MNRQPTGEASEIRTQLQLARRHGHPQVDLGRDWRAREAVTLDIGPVLHLDDPVAAKATPLLGRALARDFIDVAAALDRYSRSRLLQLAFARDPGLRVLDVAFAAQQTTRPAARQPVPVLRAQFRPGAERVGALHRLAA